MPDWADARAYTHLLKETSNQILKFGLLVPCAATHSFNSRSPEDGFKNENEVIRGYELTADQTEMKRRAAGLGFIRYLGPLYSSNESGILTIVAPSVEFVGVFGYELLDFNELPRDPDTMHEYQRNECSRDG